MPISSSRPGRQAAVARRERAEAAWPPRPTRFLPGVGSAQLLEPRDEIVQVSTARCVRGHLAQRRDGHGLAELGSARNGRSVGSHREPTSPARVIVEGAEVHTPLPEAGSVGITPDTSPPELCAPTGDPLELGREAHAARIGVVENGPRPRAVRTSAPPMTVSERCSRSARIRKPSSPRFHPTAVRCSTSPAARGSSQQSFSAAAFASPGSTRAQRCSPSRRRLENTVELVEAAAESMPFADESFDHLTFTYLLRYVDDPGATLAEIARVVRPGGVVASLEFGVPRGSRVRSGSSTSGQRSRCRGELCETDGARLAASSAGRSASSGRATRSSASWSSGAQQACTSSASAV